MELIRVAPPAEPVVTLTEARLHLRVDPTGSPPAHEDDALIEAMVQAAIDTLDGVNGWLGRALVTQTWRLSLPAFPAGAIALPLTSPQPDGSPPPDVVQEIAYTDPDGAVQTLDPSLTRVVSEADPIRVERATGAAWPATYGQDDAVRVTYKAGYGDPSAVPSLIRGYILMYAGLLYENRETAAQAVSLAPVPFIRDSLEGLRARGTLIAGGGQ